MAVLKGSAFLGAGTVAGRGCIMCAIAIVLRDDRGLELIPPIKTVFLPFIAIVLRDDRGLELEFNPLKQLIPPDCDRSSGRSRIGTVNYLTARSCRVYCDRSSGRSRIGT